MSCLYRGVEDDRQGSRENRLPEFALRFALDSVATVERIRRRGRGCAEELVIEERPKIA